MKFQSKPKEKISYKEGEKRIEKIIKNTKKDDIIKIVEQWLLDCQLICSDNEWNSLKEKLQQAISEMECEAIGVGFYERNLEYQLWNVFDAPQSGIEIQHLVSIPYFDPLQDESFRPCAVVCTQCEVIPNDSLLPSKLDFGSLRLYSQVSVE